MGMKTTLKLKLIEDWKMENLELNGGRCLVKVMLVLRRLMMRVKTETEERKEMWRGEEVYMDMEVLRIRGCSLVGFIKMLLILGLMGIEKNRKWCRLWKL